MKTIEDSDYEVVEFPEKCYEKLPENGSSGLKRCGRTVLAESLRTIMGLGKTLQVITFLWSEFLDLRLWKPACACGNSCISGV